MKLPACSRCGARGPYAEPDLAAEQKLERPETLSRAVLEARNEG